MACLCFEFIIYLVYSHPSLLRNIEIFGSKPPYIQIKPSSYSFCVKIFTSKVDLHLSWLTTENIKITKQRKVAEHQVKLSSKHKKTLVQDFRGLVSDIYFKLLRTGCPIVQDLIQCVKR